MTRRATATRRDPTWAELPAWRGRGTVLRALFTSYEEPDPALLVEDFLPTLLSLDREPSDERAAHDIFLTELHERLKGLRGRLTFIFSPSSAATQRHWLWTLVHRAQVGAEARAVQHAKLWVVHRAPPGDGASASIEIVLSSTNLTRSGLRGQIQAGWRAHLPLEARTSRTRLGRWGVLPAFIEELIRQSGLDEGLAQVWTDLLARAHAPSDVSFVASVPGTHTPRTLRSRPWGVAGLANTTLTRAGRNRVHIHVPTVGNWTEAELRAWAHRLGTTADRITLVWLDEHHPWAVAWRMSARALDGIKAAGIQTCALCGPRTDEQWGSWMHEEHVPTDPRWSHAKLYWLTCGNRRRVLVTSANFSPSAWGRPIAKRGFRIENFELGVLLPVDGCPLDGLPRLVRPCTTPESPRESEPPITWSDASWDGRTIRIRIRTRSVGTPLPDRVIVARIETHDTVEAAWRFRKPHHLAQVAWPGDHGLPLAVTVRSGSNDHVIPVVDQRPDVVLRDEPCPVIPPEEALLIRLWLLEERYDYRTLDPLDLGRVLSGEPTPATGTALAPGYGVPAYEEARRRFATVDVWSKRLADAETEVEEESILADGRSLAVLWAQVPGSNEPTLPARLAATELNLRIREAGRHD